MKTSSSEQIAREAARQLRDKGQFIGYEGTLSEDEITAIILSVIERGHDITSKLET